MAVDQECNAELVPHFIDERAERRVVRPIALFQPQVDFFWIQFRAVNRLAVGDHPWNDPKSRQDTRGLAINRTCQWTVEHPGIQFVGGAVHIGERSRE